MVIYCPECEAANAADAEVCGQCGHRLGTEEQRPETGGWGGKRRWGLGREVPIPEGSGEPSHVDETARRRLRDLGGIRIIAGLVAGAGMVALFMGGGVSVAGRMLGFGILLWTLTGIWGTLERMAGK